MACYSFNISYIFLNVTAYISKHCIVLLKTVQTTKISRGFIFAFLILLPLCGIIEVILTIFSAILDKREKRVNMYARKYLRLQ